MEDEEYNFLYQSQRNWIKSIFLLILFCIFTVIFFLFGIVSAIDHNGVTQQSVIIILFIIGWLVVLISFIAIVWSSQTIEINNENDFIKVETYYVNKIWKSEIQKISEATYVTYVCGSNDHGLYHSYYICGPLDFTPNQFVKKAANGAYGYIWEINVSKLIENNDLNPKHLAKSLGIEYMKINSGTAKCVGRNY